MRTIRFTACLALLALCTLAPLQAAAAQGNPQEIMITAKRFAYAPNEIKLKKGQTVTLVLKSEDTTHGLKSVALNLDTLIEPGKETRVTVTPTEAGQFPAFCNKFCGAGHKDMKMTFIVE